MRGGKVGPIVAETVGVRPDLGGIKDDAGADGGADVSKIIHDLFTPFEVGLHTSVLEQEGRRPFVLELLQSTQNLQEGVEGAGAAACEATTQTCH